jgi:hypothetical protein
MTSRASLAALLLPLLLLGALRLSGQGEPEAASLVLPPGKPELGLSLFIEKGCHQCHSAGTTKLPEVDLAPRLVIELGGDLHAAWTRDDFARAILNPRHLVAEDYRVAMMRLGDNFKAENSPMPEYADLLRASDLIHLAAFLDSLNP